MRRVHLALTTLVVGVFLLGAVGTASARNFRILNSERGFRFAWSEDGSSESGGAIIHCEVTLEGTFGQATFAKTNGLQIGNVTRAIVGNPCRRGSMRVLTETLPWPVQYASFSGTLPNITGIKIIILRESFLLEEGMGGSCLYASEVAHPIRYIMNLAEAGSGLKRVETLTIDETASIPLRGNLGCELLTVTWSGTATATVLGETAKTIIALI